MSISIRIYQLLCILVLVCLTSCLPIPTTRQPLDVQAVEFEISPDIVLRETVFMVGAQEEHTPVNYNGSLVTKFTRPSPTLSSTSVSKSKTIVVMMPGIYAGANTMEPLARQLIAAQDNLEVWTIDRRANLLEDTSVLRRSVLVEDPMLAYDYYIKYFGQNNGYNVPDPKEVSFMQYWGLELHLADLHEVIKEAARESDELYLLGHSLGAGMVSFYTAFQAEADRAGEEFIDGLILLEGVLGRTGGFDGIRWFDWFGGLDIAPGSESDALVDLQSVTGLNTYLPLIDEEFIFRSVLGLLARFDPEGLSPFYEFPVTNRAAFGVVYDDNFETSTAFGVSLGDIRDANLSGNIIPFILDGAIGAYSKSLVGIVEGAEKVSWNTTLSGTEACDIDSFAEYHSNQDINQNEWYFPVELMRDIAAYDMTLEGRDNFIAMTEVNVPTLAIGAERGLVQTLDIFSAYANLRAGDFLSMVIVEDFVHGDILCAEENPATAIVLGWLEQLNNIRNN